MADHWNVRYTLPGKQPQEYGGTGLPGEEFAVGVYARLCERARTTGASVTLLKNGQVVASFSKEADGKG